MTRKLSLQDKPQENHHLETYSAQHHLNQQHPQNISLQSLVQQLVLSSQTTVSHLQGERNFRKFDWTIQKREFITHKCSRREFAFKESLFKTQILFVCCSTPAKAHLGPEDRYQRIQWCLSRLKYIYIHEQSCRVSQRRFWMLYEYTSAASLAKCCDIKTFLMECRYGFVV